MGSCGGPETNAGQAIWQSLDKCQKLKVLMAHGKNSTLQKLSIKIKEQNAQGSLFSKN